MKRSVALAVIGLLLLVGSAWSSEVINIEVSYQNGTTVARIDVKGPVRFTHETEIPKNGRPDRVIVDVLSATHELGDKEFLNLPPCVITGVRTSQYAVTPEKIVRIVFDLTTAPLYRIDSDGKSISVLVDHKGTKIFSTWSTSAVVAARKAQKKPILAAKSTKSTKASPSPKAQAEAKIAKQNRAIETDRMASLAGETVAKKPAVKAEPQKLEKEPLKTSDRRFSARTFSEQPSQPEPKPAEKPSPVTLAAADTPEKTEAPVKTTEPAAKPVRKTVAKIEVKPESPKAPTPKAAPAKSQAVTKTATKKKVDQPAPSPIPIDKVKTQKIAAKPKAAPDKKTTVAQAPKPKVEPKKAIEKPKAAPDKKTTVAQAPKPKVEPKKAIEKPKAAPGKKATVARTTKSSATRSAQGQQALAKKVAAKPQAKKKSSSKQAGKPKKSTAVASKDPTSKPAGTGQQRPTARFRRKGQSAKIRGTMVAEFPKRLVIKYKTGGRRDPFGSLIDAKRTYNDPIETRIPNVEGLQLVGIIDSDGGTNRALFEDKAGFSYMLKTGDKVRNGYVLRVEADQVYFQIFEYGWSRTVALTME